MKLLNKIIFLISVFYFIMGVVASSAVTTTIVLQPGKAGKDTYISSKSSEVNRNFGHSPEFDMIAWNDTTNVPFYYRGLIDFDLSSIPPFATITNAKISLYHNSQSALNQGINSCCGANSSLLTVTSPWDENTVTWNTQPTTSNLNQVALPPLSSYTQDFTNIDCTAMIQDRKNNPSTNFGMMMKLNFELYYDGVFMASGDHPNPALHPKLEITFTTAGQPYLSAAPAMLDFGSQAEGTLSAVQTISIFGSDMTPATGTVTVTRTNSNFQIYDPVNGWGSTAAITYSAGAINTTLNVRFLPRYPEVEAGTLKFNGGGIAAASLPTIALSGSGTICTTLFPSADALVSQSNPTSNFGTSQELNSMAWIFNGNQLMRSLINFDLTSIPSSATIGSARLSLYYNPTSTAGNGQQYGFYNESLIRRVTSAWNENTVTWNNQPPSVDVNTAVMQTSTSPTQNYTNIDVTDLVKDMRANPGSSGFLIRLTVEQVFQEMLFASREHPNAALHPRLDICYTPSTPSAAVPTLTEWGLIIFAGLILIIGFIQIRKV